MWPLTAALHNVEDCLKAKAKIYCLPRTTEETRVQWLQPPPPHALESKHGHSVWCRSDTCTCSLCHWLNGAICKIYGRKLVPTKLCIVNSRVLESTACDPECGLYKASDKLLGDQLCGKSDTIKWVESTTEVEGKLPWDNRSIWRQSDRHILPPETLRVRWIVFVWLCQVLHTILRWVAVFIISLQSHAYQTTSCLTLKMRAEKRTITILCFCCLCITEMNMICSSQMKTLSNHSFAITLMVLVRTSTTKDCRRCC